ncbi:MAG: lipase family protein [Castellaniella sp.]
MNITRVIAAPTDRPFPVHDGLPERLLTAHDPALPAAGERDATLAHVLGLCAGYAYADAPTVSTMMARAGLAGNACAQLTQVVDAMFIYASASLVQSACGRVLIIAYRGTELAALGSWLGDLDCGREYLALRTHDGAIETPRVHAGFHRNFRALHWEVEQALSLALQGRSLADPGQDLAHPLQALFVTGHSLGAAMAELFALKLARQGANAAVVSRLRAVYTFGGPMVIGDPFPAQTAARAGARLYRHVIPADPVPALPAAAWGHFAHFGQEYRHADGQWQRVSQATTQLERVRELPRAMLAALRGEKQRAAQRYSIAAHGPHQYLAALRPPGRASEFGDMPTESD